MKDDAALRRVRQCGIACARPWSAALIAASLFASNLAAPAQDQRTAPRDVIFARKTLMNSTGEKLAELERMASQNEVDVNRARGDGNAMSVMLTAFPHLFPPASNQWKEGATTDPAADTAASPDIWVDFADFYRQAAGAAKTANELSRADNADEIKRLTRALGIACDTCHALYYKE